jgi:hypothetical protein
MAVYAVSPKAKCRKPLRQAAFQCRLSVLYLPF